MTTDEMIKRIEYAEKKLENEGLFSGGLDRVIAALRAAPPAPAPELVALQAAVQQWAIYCFNNHGDDAKLYNGLADLGGVSADGAGWTPATPVSEMVKDHGDALREMNRRWVRCVERSDRYLAKLEALGVDPDSPLEPPASPVGETPEGK